MTATNRGLTAEQVLASRAEHGANVLTPPPRVSWWRQYLGKFDDPVIRILMIAAGIAITVGAFDGHVAEGIGIIAAIFLATFLAFWNERRASREFDILNITSDDVPVKVLRDGGYALVPRRDVVVGDCVFLEVGEEVPADGSLTEAVGLLINESRLTGESHPVEKSIQDRLSRGTTIADGYGLAIISAVGDRTEIGRTLRESIEDAGADTPLNRQLATLSRIIGVVGFTVAVTLFYALLGHGLIEGTIRLDTRERRFLIVLCVSLSVALVNIWLPIVFDALMLLGFGDLRPNWLGGKSWPVAMALGAMLFAAAILAGFIPAAPAEWLSLADARQLLRNFMISVTVIVVAVPEGLAMSVTLSLAYSMRKMTASNTLVRRMAACETIGAVTVICSDKTGTLTLNEMRVVETHFANVPMALIHDAIAANSTAHLSRDPDRPAKAVGNPTEGALLLWLEERNVDYLPLRDAFPLAAQWTFNTERKYMATLGKSVLHVKGAPEIVLALCESVADHDRARLLSKDDRRELTAAMEAFQSRGMRTLALAYRTELPTEREIETLAEKLVWLGLVAIADPVRPDVPAAIADCRIAGVAVKIVTGDSLETAREIGRQIGLDDAIAETGPRFAAMTDAEASETASKLTILARARPADKLRLVKLLKTRGEVVAVTGDGVNDGPALNFADVGLAMGKTGTAVAREASDIILLDDSFPSIVNAVRWGRSLYENIQRFILFQLTINVAALGLAVLGPFIGFELPLTVMQMLWVNLIMDTFAALALATEPPHDEVLQRPPRSPKAFIVTPGMARAIFGVGAAFLMLLAAMIILWQDRLPHDDTPSRPGTLVFTTFVLLQFWNLFNAKAMGRRGSVLPTLGNNPSFLFIAAAILIGQVMVTQFGSTVFRTVPLSLEDWLILMAATSPVLWLGEVWRLLRRG